MITSAAHASWPSDHAIPDLEAAGLGYASMVRFKVFTLPDHLIVRPLGRLAAADWTGVEAMVSRILFAA